MTNPEKQICSEKKCYISIQDKDQKRIFVAIFIFALLVAIFGLFNPVIFYIAGGILGFDIVLIIVKILYSLKSNERNESKL